MKKPKVFVKHIGWTCDVEFIDFQNNEVEVDLTNGNGDTSIYRFDEVEFILEDNTPKLIDKIKRAIYTQHCTMNHMENTEYERGAIHGLIQASNIVDKYYREHGVNIN